MRLLNLLLAAASAIALPSQHRLKNMAKPLSSSFDPVRLPSIPLAVRSPYLNTWLDGPSNEEKGYLAGVFPRFWTSAITGWQGFVKVDGINYNWMGQAPGAMHYVQQTSLRVTSTRSIFTVKAGQVELTIEFLSPVYPEDLLRQSITSSYLEVSAVSLDGQPHNIELYADVSGEWASGDQSAMIEWESNRQDGVLYSSFWRQKQDEFNEVADQASWGKWYWATGDQDNVTTQIGADQDVRRTFITSGALDNTIDKSFRAINDRWPVFAFSRNLGPVSTTPISTLFTIGYTQPNAILFQGAGDQPQAVPSLWASHYQENQLVSVFFADWSHAQLEADSIDATVSSDSQAVSPGQDYSTITTSSVRQTFGALTYTNTLDEPFIWQKEISSASFVQTVDVLYPTWPFMLYFNPNLIKYTLAPLLENQKSGHYPNAYAMHDLGRYPRALGYPKGDDEPMPLEESSNMIILMLSYAQRTGNTGYLEDNRSLLEQWSQFLIENAKIPANQLSTDDFAGPAA